MAGIQYFCFRKVLLLYLVFYLFACVFAYDFSETQPKRQQLLGRRRMLEKEEQPKKKSNSLSTKNQTKLIKPITDSTKATTDFLTKSQLKKLNSISKISNSTKPKSISSTKSSDLFKTSSPKNKTFQTVPGEKKYSEIKQKSSDKSQFTEKKSAELKTRRPDKSQSPEKKSSELKSKIPDKNHITEKKPNQQKSPKPIKPVWMDQDDEDDFVSEFRDLPTKFQQTFLPDLEIISISSKAYLNKANKEITEGFKPIVGNKYAPTIAPVISCVFILVPFLLVSLIFNRIKAYFSLQKLLIFIQVYLSIYFSILCVSSLVTGLEPLKFFYATSQSTYVCLQVLQTLGYVLYLLSLLLYLVLVFSTDSGLGLKLLGLVQTFVGFAIGLHYYTKVFHRAVLHQPPRTNWKVHGIYATCFLLICLLTRLERRKKAYLEDGGEEGKKN